jgi:L-alanine-DL-glutamate epimerase-like enolase superfamily enzyme
MSLRGEVLNHNLLFKFDAGTSRGILRNKTSYFIKIFETSDPSIFGIGECTPLKGLSPDYGDELEMRLLEILQKIPSYKKPVDIQQAVECAEAIAGASFPSIRFALEVAFIDLLYGGKRKIFHNKFYEGINALPINGLIWMGNSGFMLRQIKEKIDSGFKCIKIKIGAIDFKAECSILGSIRKKYSPEEIELRVDANGAFSGEDVFDKLEKLSKFHIHSIEQPVAPGQPHLMEKICRESPISVALDEELIGIHGNEKQDLLGKIKPAYIILKPTLLGGLKETSTWISLAEEQQIGWWITSALESNIGLNAICQFTAEYDNPLPQGLGTGQLYHNNISSPLEIEKGKIFYNNNKHWELHTIGL